MPSGAWFSAVTDPWVDVVLEAWTEGQRLSAVGPGPVTDHLDHSRALAAQLEPPQVAIDLGSGAGVPGLALAGIWPDSRWTLIDAAQRRVRLLTATIDRLGWGGRVTAIHGRAEDLAHDPALRGVADLVTARSFGPPAVTAECGAGFLADGALLVVTEPPDPGVDRWPADSLAAMSLAPEASPSTDEVRVQRLRRVGPVPDDLPRRPGIPTKRPRF